MECVCVFVSGLFVVLCVYMCVNGSVIGSVCDAITLSQPLQI